MAAESFRKFQFCPHCEQTLALRTYREHFRLFYDTTSRVWTKPCKRRRVGSNGLDPESLSSRELDAEKPGAVGDSSSTESSPVGESSSTEVMIIFRAMPSYTDLTTCN